ncbi:GNAT family N-acetyltransferase [Alkalicoccus chagannorensis]|uniref:GNAT family N-acetyltransferase n=1 Tax=Alkalicoccus chagannorensis TaxID=427072 RepID=UPI00040E4C54|nr:GNAT family N-acetyltransferase [Alkalicoccus chagannorensis]
MRTYTIERLTPETFQRCSAIWNVDEEKDMAAWCYEELVQGNRETFVYVEDGLCRGEASLVFEHEDPHYVIPGRRLYVSRMIVRKEDQGRGIGRLLLDYLITYAASLSYRELALGVDTDNAPANRLYERSGFTTVLAVEEDEAGEYRKLLKQLDPNEKSIKRGC